MLSTVLSFLPYGDVLSKATKKFDEFYKQEEIMQKAERIRTLAESQTQFDQIIGETILKIIRDLDYQKKITTITDEVLKPITDGWMKKVAHFVGDLCDKLRPEFFKQIEKASAAEKLGIKDANFLVEKWAQGQISETNLAQNLAEAIFTQN